MNRGVYALLLSGCLILSGCNEAKVDTVPQEDRDIQGVEEEVITANELETFDQSILDGVEILLAGEYFYGKSHTKYSEVFVRKDGKTELVKEYPSTGIPYILGIIDEGDSKNVFVAVPCGGTIGDVQIDWFEIKDDNIDEKEFPYEVDEMKLEGTTLEVKSKFLNSVNHMDIDLDDELAKIYLKDSTLISSRVVTEFVADNHIRVEVLILDMYKKTRLGEYTYNIAIKDGRFVIINTDGF